MYFIIISFFVNRNLLINYIFLLFLWITNFCFLFYLIFLAKISLKLLYLTIKLVHYLSLTNLKKECIINALCFSYFFAYFGEEKGTESQCV